MAKSSLRDMVREMVDEESKVAKQAKAQGLEYLGFGRWGKDGKMTHTTTNGKLIPYSKAGMEKGTGMHFGRGKKADQMYTPSTNLPAATMTQPGVLKRSPERPKPSPDDQRIRGASQDDLGAHNSSAERIISAVDDKLYGQQDKLSDRYNTEMSAIEFSREFGIPEKAIRVYSRYAGGYDAQFTYNEDDDTVFIQDPADV